MAEPTLRSMLEGDIETVRVDIGQGFAMDDFIMQQTL